MISNFNVLQLLIISYLIYGSVAEAHSLLTQNGQVVIAVDCQMNISMEGGRATTADLMIVT